MFKFRIFILLLILPPLANCILLEKWAGDESKKMEEELTKQSILSKLIFDSYRNSFNSSSSNQTQEYEQEISLFFRNGLGFSNNKFFARTDSFCHSSSSYSSQIPNVVSFGSDLMATSYYKGGTSSVSTVALLRGNGEIYFVENNNIKKLPANPTSSSTATQLYAATGTIYRLAKDSSETYLYFIEGTNLKRIPFNGGSAEQLSDLSTLGYNISASNTSTTKSSLVVDTSGNVFVLGFNYSSNGYANKIVKLNASSSYSASILAGDSGNLLGTTDGTGTSARFMNISDLAVNSSNLIYALDQSSLRTVTSSGTVTTVLNSAVSSSSFLIVEPTTGDIYTSPKTSCGSIYKIQNGTWTQTLLSVKFKVKISTSSSSYYY